MATLKVTAPNTVTGNTVTIYFTSDETLTSIDLSKGDGSYINAQSFTQNSATFDISSWGNGTYSNCFLRGTYAETTLPTHGNIIVSTNSLTVAEKSTVTFTVKLDSAPVDNQVITLSASNDNISLNKTNITFTPSNYSTAQTITVTGTHKSTSYTSTNATITISSANVSSKTVNVTITNIDTKPSDTFEIVVSNYGFNVDGSLDNNASFTHTETYIPFDGNLNKTVTFGVTGWTRYMFYDSNKKVIGTDRSTTAISSITMNALRALNSSAVYVRISINQSTTITLS